VPNADLPSVALMWRALQRRLDLIPCLQVAEPRDVSRGFFLKSSLRGFPIQKAASIRL
jgi:hypothetical protein